MKCYKTQAADFGKYSAAPLRSATANMHSNPPSLSFHLPAHKAQGMALLVTLIFLGVVTLWAILSMDGALLQEKMVTHTVAEKKAFQAAQAARADGYQWITDSLAQSALPFSLKSTGGNVWDSDVGAQGFSTLRTLIPEQWDAKTWAEKGHPAPAVESTELSAHWILVALGEGPVHISGQTLNAHYYRLYTQGAYSPGKVTQRNMVMFELIRLLCSPQNTQCSLG